MATKTKKKPTKAQLTKIWEEGKPIKGKNPDMWRKDAAGTVIKFTEYNKNSKYGWEIV